jgi:integrase
MSSALSNTGCEGGAEVKTDLKYVKRDKDRHGKDRVVLRLNGRRIRLHEPVGSIEFEAEYRAALALAGSSYPTPVKPVANKTLEWLGGEYMKSAEFRRLNEQSRRTRRTIYESCFREPINRRSKERMGDCPLEIFSAEHVRFLRDRKRALPGAANNRKKYLGSMFAWAAERGLWQKPNPARDVKPMEYASNGFHSWTDEEIAAFEAHHPIGTKARLAIALFRYTGVRRGDIVKLGERHIKDEVLSFIPSKTSYRRAEPVVLPVLPELRAIIRATPSVGLRTFLVTEQGKPFTAAGFGGWFRKRCDEAGLPQCSAHGIRKAAAVMAAEKGASDRELMAMFGWSTSGQANAYTKAASQRQMAARAVNLLANKAGPQNGLGWANLGKNGKGRPV